MHDSYTKWGEGDQVLASMRLVEGKETFLEVTSNVDRMECCI